MSTIKIKPKTKGTQAIMKIVVEQWRLKLYENRERQLKNKVLK